MKFNQPLVTIITPSLNQGQFIEETILSIIHQTYKNIQYILIDGGSTDCTMEVVSQYSDHIDIILNEKDNGQADAINKGFRLTKGELVGWVNSDDVLYPDCITEIVKLYIQNPNGGVYYTSEFDWINEKSKIFAKQKVEIKNRNYLLNHNYVIVQPGSFYPLLLVEAVNYLDINCHYCMDLDLWLKLLKLGDIYPLPEKKPYAAFRFYKGTKTETGKIMYFWNIRDVLIKNGAKWHSKNILLKVYFYAFKSLIKTGISSITKKIKFLQNSQ